MAGTIMIVGGCLGLGLWYRQQLVLKVQVLKDLQQILEMLQSEIRYGKATLPECCKRVSTHMKEPYKSSFLEVFCRMKENTGEKFEVIFSNALRQCFLKLPIEEKDKEQFLRFVSPNSFTEERMQLCAIEQSEDNLRRRVEELERENMEKCRMAVGLGVMSGLLLVIVLL